MMKDDTLARAALQIAKILGSAEEWDEPDQLLEAVAQALHEAGVPALDEEQNQSFWRHMSVDDTLGQMIARRELFDQASAVPDTLTPTLGIHIDASLASPEAITAIFDGLRSIIRAEGGVRDLTPKDPYSRSADD